MTIEIKELESGYLFARGNGPCEYAQWPKGYFPKHEDFFPQASEKFRLELLQILLYEEKPIACEPTQPNKQED